MRAIFVLGVKISPFNAQAKIYFVLKTLYFFFVGYCIQFFYVITTPYILKDSRKCLQPDTSSLDQKLFFFRRTKINHFCFMLGFMKLVVVSGNFVRIRFLKKTILTVKKIDGQIFY